MARYILFLHERPEAFARFSPAEMARIIGEYRAWAQSLRTRNALAGGEKLADDPGRVMRAKGSDVVVADGPYAESRELVGGYFIVIADSYDAAAALARDCPHLRYGGAIELRAIHELA
ncbi:MAG: transcription initiation protein [Alphaproteobacteria bacterium]|nr:transcription initiation protein [Alphaproteobacteria bacterium]